ncbi:MAG: phosphopantothenoylcysteine decarboxylase [Phycisphaera sp.]|nr:MAG: phosphopantothenoylcysteine decarboxylase [Phycisphaera sp.]
MTTKNTPDPFPTGAISPRVLITAGPTHEPIDEVRYLGNRSSGKMGIRLADQAASLGWPTTLLLGPSCHAPDSQAVTIKRFGSVADLHELLKRLLEECDVLVMAAAVADYTPESPAVKGKLRRSEAEGLTIRLSPTPDLLAGCCEVARPDQLMVGFALEPREQLLETARKKLERKGADLIIANPLETMEAGDIEATIMACNALRDHEQSTDGKLGKADFAVWLLPRLQQAWLAKRNTR